MKAQLARMVGVASSLALVAALAATNSEAVRADTVSDGEQACWVAIDTGESLCVDDASTLADAVWVQYGLRLIIPDNSSSGTAAETRGANPFAVISPDTTVVISVIYKDINYGGSSYFMSSSIGCNGGYSWLGAIGWNDSVSSFKSFAGCETILYADINYAGSSTGWAVNIANLGSVGMNDKASSWLVS